MEDIFTVTCSGTGTLVKDFESWSHPRDSSNGVRGPCTGQSPWYDLSQVTQTGNGKTTLMLLYNKQNNYLVKLNRHPHCYIRVFRFYALYIE